MAARTGRGGGGDLRPVHGAQRAQGVALPPRVLVGTVVTGRRLHALSRWEAGLRGQATDLRWDVLLAAPAPLAGGWLHRWVREEPFGPYHRVRLRSPADDDEAAALLMGKFAGWVSYSSLLVLELDVWMSPDCLQSLHEAAAPWAAAGSADRAVAPLACALLTREAIERPDITPAYVPGARWERIPAPAPASEEAV